MDTKVVLKRVREGERTRGYRIMGKVFEEAVEGILEWVVEGYEYNEERTENESEI